MVFFLFFRGRASFFLNKICMKNIFFHVYDNNVRKTVGYINILEPANQVYYIRIY